MLKIIKLGDFELLDTRTIGLWSNNTIKFEVTDGIKLSVTFRPTNEVEVPEVKSEIIDDCLNFTFICHKSSEFEFGKTVEMSQYNNKKFHCYFKIMNIHKSISEKTLTYFIFVERLSFNKYLQEVPSFR